MDNVSLIIESFNDWGKPWTFYEFVMKNSQISEKEKDEFLNTYRNASEFKLWNFSDLAECSKNSTKYLESNTRLSEKAIRQIVNAIAYEWR